MEPWSYVSEGKGLLFTDEMDLPVDSFARSRKALIGWDLKPSADFGPVESMEFMDFGFGDMNKKPFYGNSSMGIFSSEFGNVYGEEESGSKHSSSLMDSNSQESSLIDLKLGRLTDYRDAQDGRFLKESSVVSSCRPGLMVKKARTTNSYSHTPCCQVYGCNKDLSSSKDYHKRHKVCEAHSKTAKVIVNGIEQRFCQQCSRFHLLAEFDDGKRSCRKRLAGHNERRRKIHFKTLTEKPRKLLHSFQGTKFLGNSMPKGMCFITPNIHQGEFIYPERNVQDNQFQLVKSKEKPIYNPQYAVRIRNGQLPLKSFNGTGKQLVTGTFSSEGLNAPNVPSTVKESSWFSGSNYALSLLSAQSQNMSSHGAGIQMIRPLINQTSIKKSAGVSSSNSTGVCKTGAVAVSDACHTANFEVQPDGYFQDSDLFSARFCFPPENGDTVDLLQLSTHLKQVERNSIQVKQENEDQCYFLTS